MSFKLTYSTMFNPPAEMLATDAKSTLSRLGLDQYLSPTRKNGLFAMVERMKAWTTRGSDKTAGEVKP